MRVRVKIAPSGKSTVGFSREPASGDVEIALRLRPEMSVEEFLHEAIHVAQLAGLIKDGEPMTPDVACKFEEEVLRWTQGVFKSR